jgi:CheY-like chemotaxis protein
MSGVSLPAAFAPSPVRQAETGEPTKILVVDDSAFDRELIGRLLEPLADLKLVFACNGSEGLAAVRRENPALILTDLIMPDMEGLELVQQVRAQQPTLSVILVTAYGSEEVAMQALRAGAANYIPKKRLMRDLVPTIRQVLAIASLTRERTRILRCLVRRESAFVLENDPDLIMPLLKLIQEELEGMGLCDSTRQVQVGVALQEAICNALFHGNLEVSSDLRQDDESKFDAVASERRWADPYCSRRIRIQVQLDRDAARFVVSDDGSGYDRMLFDQPLQPEDIHRIGGRGLLLIRTFMDQVSLNQGGNQITMIKYRTPVS